MKYTFYLLILLSGSQAWCQPGENMIDKILQAQKKISAISYTLQRSDTFVTGQTRIIKGHAKIKPLPRDTVFGFAFWGKRDDLDEFSVYDGKMGYDVNGKSRKYEIARGRMLPPMLGAPGGQVIFQDMARLDTAGATRFELKDDGKFAHLTFYYPDIKEYDVERRYKILTIDKTLMLPVAMRKYQETLGKVQHLNYEASEIKLNENALKYDFAAPDFLESFTQEVPASNKSLLSLNDKMAPAFRLNSFAGEVINSADLRGKVVLLDFWEVWCGPCVASMPKVDVLYTKYKQQGLQVFGVTNETDQLESAKKLVAKKGVGFTMLSGNASVVKDYKINAIPLYVLIDKKGMVRFTSAGFSDKMEDAIKKILAE